MPLSDRYVETGEKHQHFSYPDYSTLLFYYFNTGKTKGLQTKEEGMQV